MPAASTASSATAPITVVDLEIHAATFDADRAAAIYREHGCLVVRGLASAQVDALNRDIATAAQQAIALLPRATKIVEGWATPDGSLFLPAPAGFARDQQIMLLPINYRNSAAFLQTALVPEALDLAERVVGPDVELFMEGQVVYKEPVGGHPKHLHQDAAYFEHRLDGPMATLIYCVDTDLVNGALHVVPGSHRQGLLAHVTTFSHLGLDEQAWPWECALPIVGKAGDAIFFHVQTIHGSKENHGAAPRPVVINRYRNANDYVVVSATTAENRSQAESDAARKAMAQRRVQQRGLLVRGSRRWSDDG
ncbi:MAG: phytanoyl-CoA dioxygenase family protein [Planctomycetes bacterium]|nr:phytanoyl-CoA dioxygenase family protein [Planctomycetota bacterium]